MAVRLEDEDERICNLAKLFFNELSKKGSNPIYNVLPDILGKLSYQNLKEESFCYIMQFLIGSIKKDNQMEALVEKLCNRFVGVAEKSIRKLMESFKAYEHALSEDTVMENFKNIINKGKKFAKPELKSSIEEFEEKINKFHAEKKEQELTAKNAQAHQLKIDSSTYFVAIKKDAEESDRSEITEVKQMVKKVTMLFKGQEVCSQNQKPPSQEHIHVHVVRWQSYNLMKMKFSRLLFIEEVSQNPG